MNTYADKTSENKSRAIANSLLKQHSISAGTQLKAYRPNNDLNQSKSVIQRAVIRIGTESGENGELTYAESGSIDLDNGQTLKGIILVLIHIPETDRNKGHGGTLMRHFMANVVKTKPCYLDVKAVGEEGLSNEQLEAWYRKYGFETIGRSATGPVMGINVSWEDRGMGVGKKMTDYLGKLVQ